MVGRRAHILRAFRMDEDRRPRMEGTRRLDPLYRDDLVCRAVARPQRVRAPQEPGDVSAKVLVGHEEDLFVGTERAHHALGVAARHAHVALGLHLGGGVHVADGLRAEMPRLERAHLLARDHVRHRTSGGRLRDEHRLPRVQDRRRLGHEVDAAEDDHLRLHRRRLARELQRVARVIGDVLHLAARVVVCENDGFPLRRQLSNFLLSRHTITPDFKSSLMTVAPILWYWYFHVDNYQN